MTSRPPPLPKSKSPPPIRSQKKAGPQSLDSQSSQLLYVVSAILFLLANLLLFFAIRLHQTGNGLANGNAATEGGDGAGESAEVLGPEKSSSGEMVESEAADAEPNSNAADNSSIGADEIRGNGPSTDKRPSINGEVSPDEELEGLVSIPIFVGDQGSTGPGITSRGGINPLLSALNSQSTVFVIDQSGSMAGDRLNRVLHSMKESIHRLQDHQQFLILFFSTGFQSHPTLSTLAPATEANKKIALQWLDTIRSGGGTQPVDAMLHAIQQKPERIILLSDGEFDPLGVGIITSANQSQSQPIRIDGIGLAETVQTLQDLAKQNQGIYYQAR